MRTPLKKEPARLAAESLRQSTSPPGNLSGGAAGSERPPAYVLTNQLVISWLHEINPNPKSKVARPNSLVPLALKKRLHSLRWLGLFKLLSNNAESQKEMVQKNHAPFVSPSS